MFLRIVENQIKRASWRLSVQLQCVLNAPVSSHKRNIYKYPILCSKINHRKQPLSLNILNKNVLQKFPKNWNSHISKPHQFDRLFTKEVTHARWNAYIWRQRVDLHNKDCIAAQILCPARVRAVTPTHFIPLTPLSPSHMDSIVLRPNPQSLSP